jgi:predicted RNA-binding Zn ribbon-like protein
MIGFDDFVGGAPALDFVNTVGGIRTAAHSDKLQAYEDLVHWAQMAGMFGRKEADALAAQGRANPQAAERVLRQARNFREALHRVFAARLHGKSAPPDALVAVNAQIGRALAHARLGKAPGGYAWTWDLGTGELDAPLWIAARSAGELLTSPEIGRLRECASDTCGWFFLDLSRNRSRRWCDMKGCGNRAKLRRYRSGMTG